jgi:hypothetical protein
MYRLIIIFSIIVSLNAPSKLAAQPGSNTIENKQYCTDYHKRACKFSNKDLEFQYNTQSRSALFRPGQSSSFSFTSFKGYDYKLTFCGEESITKGKPISFKVIDPRTKEILFDSDAENSSQEFEFTCDNSLNLKVELSLPEADEKSKKAIYGCLGFLVQSRKSLQTGFK